MTSDKQHFDIVLVGGGMVGASLASLLARANRQWSIALVEAQPLISRGAAYQPSFDARSTALSRGSVEIFQQLDLWSKLQQHATAISKVHISDRGHFVGSEITAADYPAADGDSDQNVGAVVENAWLGSVLLDHLETIDNLTVIAPATVQQLRAIQGGYQLQLAGADTAAALTTSTLTSTVTTALCLVCDGANSKLRGMVGIGASSVDYQQQAIIANVEMSDAHNGIAYERFTDTGPMALLPLGESSSAKTAALVWTLPTEQAAEMATAPDSDFLQCLQQRFGYRLGRFVGVGQRHCYPLQLTTADEQIRSHLAVMGNAAHFLHPVAGQGFNLALRDSAILVDELLQSTARGESLGSLPMLQRYVERQSFDQQATIGFSHAITKMFSSSSLPKAALRALGFIALECLPPAKQSLAAQTMGTFSSASRLDR